MKTKIYCFLISLFASCFIFSEVNAVGFTKNSTIGFKTASVLKNDPNESKPMSLCSETFREYVTCPDGTRMMTTMIDMSWECETGNYFNVFSFSFSPQEACEGHEIQP